jgi:hypothetical protein
MRNLLVLTAALMASGIGLSAEGNALQLPGGPNTSTRLAQPSQYYPPSVYRPYGYYPSVVPPPSGAVINQAPIADGTYVPPPPVTAPVTQEPVVVPAAPAAAATAQAPVVAAPAPVIAQPVIVAPPRPASCGEFRFWNGFACVDARFNTPYLGPRY